MLDGDGINPNFKYVFIDGIFFLNQTFLEIQFYEIEKN